MADLGEPERFSDEGSGRHRGPPTRPLHEEPEERDERADKESLRVSSVDLQKERNRTEHETDEYDEPALILRRGQPFHVLVKLNRAYQPDKDIITLEFSTGRKPTVGKYTLIQAKVKAEAKQQRPKEWIAEVAQNEEKDGLLIKVTSSSEAVVGEYQMRVMTKTKGEAKGAWTVVKDGENEASVYMLFNAFNADDVCYMGNERKREEYVMNETGSVYMGSSRWPYGKPWIFGQFDESALSVALYLMDKGRLPHFSRNSPIQVTRCMSKMVNNLDGDQGVLVGRWTKEYPGGTRPTEWNGSIAILDQYMKTKQPVKYGQCWVFSGLVTTLCRALGLPTRSVTNFASAHDTDSSNTIDFHFDEEGEEYEGGQYDDSVWNFHVWNESWFKRNDLPPGNDGWQAHDATPQESSEGYFQCGPAPVVAIRRGDLQLPYDCGFVFGEVNGDRVYWTVTKEGLIEPTRVLTRAVGKSISTRALNGGREDLTLKYKFPEGSEEERRAAMKAHSHGSRREYDIYDKPLAEDVKITENFPANVPVGSDVIAEVELHNSSNEIRNIKVTFTSSLVFYTGIPATEDRDVKRMNVQLKPDEHLKLSHTIKAADYVMQMVAGCQMKIFAVAKVKETHQKLFVDDVVVFTTPEVTLKVPEKVKRHEEFELTVTLVNPLHVKLTHGKFSFEGNGIRPRDGEFKIKGPIQPGAEAEAKFKITARWRRRVGIVATFSSHELDDCKGEVTLKVQ